jgi:hypothetical protein
MKSGRHRQRMRLACCLCALTFAATLSGQGRLDERIWLNFNGAAPEAVFRMIAGAMECTLKIDPAVQQKVSIRLERVTLKLALDAICESIGCRWTIDGPQLLVDPLPAAPVASPSPGGVVGNSDAVRAALARTLPAGLRFDREPLGAALDALSRAAGPGFDFHVGGAEASLPVTVDVGGHRPMDAVAEVMAAAGLKASYPISSTVDDDGVIRRFSVKLVLLGPLLRAPGSLLGVERSKQDRISRVDGGVAIMQGAVEMTVGAATLCADEVEYRAAAPEMLLRGNVRIRTSPLPAVEAKTVNRTADGVVHYRGSVKVAVGPPGTAVFADEADLSAAANEVRLRGNVTFKKVPSAR